jgi:hypothetical protein
MTFILAWFDYAENPMEFQSSGRRFTPLLLAEQADTFVSAIGD